MIFNILLDKVSVVPNFFWRVSTPDFMGGSRAYFGSKLACHEKDFQMNESEAWNRL